MTALTISGAARVSAMSAPERNLDLIERKIDYYRERQAER